MNSTAHINRFKMYDGLLLTIYNDIINLQLECLYSQFWLRGSLI